MCGFCVCDCVCMSVICVCVWIQLSHRVAPPPPPPSPPPPKTTDRASYRARGGANKTYRVNHSYAKSVSDFSLGINAQDKSSHIDRIKCEHKVQWPFPNHTLQQCALIKEEFLCTEDNRNRQIHCPQEILFCEVI